jgi:hypothetical protein
VTKILGKGDLLSGVTLKRELIPVPELDASIWMREMGAEQVIAFKKYIDGLREGGAKETTIEQDIEIMALVVSFSACDENGSLLFTQDEAKRLTCNNINLLMDLGNKALSLSRIQIGGGGLTSEATDNLPKAPTTSLSGNLPRNSRKRGGKS